MFAPKGGKRACGTQSASGNPHSTRIHTPQCRLRISSQIILIANIPDVTKAVREVPKIYNLSIISQKCLR